MKKTYLLTMKKVLLIALLAGIGTLSISCNSNDGDSELPTVPIDPPEPTTPEEKPFVGVTYMEDSVKIQLQLLNSDSVAMDTFKEGEDIIFKLTISNTSSDWVYTTPIDKFSDDNIFGIYSSNGSYVGKPWDGRQIYFIHSFLTPEMFQEHTCSWLEEPIEDMTDYVIKGSSISIARVPIRYYKLERRQPLPKGSYYTQFDVSVIEGRTTIIKMDFNIE